jgi:hypothetical protein
MKFRQFVGEEKVEEIQKKIKKKKVVQTNLGFTEEEFLKNVLRENPDGSKINDIESYLGYGLSKKALKRIFDYIKSWLIRYKIPFEAVNPYLTIYSLSNISSISVLIRKIKKEKKGKIYLPLGTLTVVSNNEKDFPRSLRHIEPKQGKDYLVLDYIPNIEYHTFLEKVFDDLNIKIIDRYCHVKLFEIESNIVKPIFYEQMMYSAPMLPNLRLGNTGLIRRK